MKLSDFQTGVPLAPLTTYQIGGPADYYYIARTPEDIQAALETARAAGIEVFILGTGANILVGDHGYRGLVIHNQADRITISNTLLRAQSGAIIASCIALATAQGLSGLEHFAGIPSSVGGALWQNLHFLDPERKNTLFIGNLLHSAVILDPENVKRRVDQEFFRFGYDYSRLHAEPLVVLEASFQLTPGEPAAIARQVQLNLEWRQKRHPDLNLFPSAGSVFQQINGAGAGRLIDQAGLRGYRLGNAQVSEKHANFIVNTGGASGREVLDLIRFVQDRTLEATGYRLTPEIQFVGEF